MTREELKEQIDELMRQYADEEIDGATYAQKMMELRIILLVGLTATIYHLSKLSTVIWRKHNVKQL